MVNVPEGFVKRKNRLRSIFAMIQPSERDGCTVILYLIATEFVKYLDFICYCIEYQRLGEIQAEYAEK